MSTIDQICADALRRLQQDPRLYATEVMGLPAPANRGLIEPTRSFAIDAKQQDKLDAERWRYIRRKLCLTGNGDGTCAMQAINLPAAIQGWPEPGQVAEFCDAAIDAAMLKAREEGK